MSLKFFQKIFPTQPEVHVEQNSAAAYAFEINEKFFQQGASYQEPRSLRAPSCIKQI